MRVKILIGLILLLVIIIGIFFCINFAKKYKKRSNTKDVMAKNEKPKLTYNTRKWTDIIDSEIWGRVIDGIIEKRRLVGSGLYSENEFSELCDFTGKVSCDYSGRFRWCKSHCVIERRGRSTASRMFYDSQVDQVVIVYRPSEVNVKGYKDKKHVLEWHLNNCNSWDDLKKQCLDPLHVMDNDPSFIGRRDDVNGLNRIAVCDSLNGPIDVYVMNDEPIES